MKHSTKGTVVKDTAIKRGCLHSKNFYRKEKEKKKQTGRKYLQMTHLQRSSYSKSQTVRKLKTGFLNPPKPITEPHQQKYIWQQWEGVYTTCHKKNTNNNIYIDLIPIILAQTYNINTKWWQRYGTTGNLILS